VKKYANPQQIKDFGQNKKLSQNDRLLVCNNSWLGWAEGFQTLEDLQSVNVTPEEEQELKQLMAHEVSSEGE